MIGDTIARVARIIISDEHFLAIRSGERGFRGELFILFVESNENYLSNRAFNNNNMASLISFSCTHFVPFAGPATCLLEWV